MAQRSPPLSRKRSTARTRRGSCPRCAVCPAAWRAPASSTAWRSSRSSSRPPACPTSTRATSCGISHLVDPDNRRPVDFDAPTDDAGIAAAPAFDLAARDARSHGALARHRQRTARGVAGRTNQALADRPIASSSARTIRSCSCTAAMCRCTWRVPDGHAWWPMRGITMARGLITIVPRLAATLFTASTDGRSPRPCGRTPSSASRTALRPDGLRNVITGESPAIVSIRKRIDTGRGRGPDGPARRRAGKCVGHGQHGSEDSSQGHAEAKRVW